jgi:Uncharacterized protein conserved in bacteria (DUF2330)
MRRSLIALGGLAVAVSSWLVAPAAEACCPAYPEGARVAIADQEILIAYDAATKREHFVRRASFESTAEGFGFLVPTPTQPEVAEAPGSVFSALRAEIKPKVVWENDYRFLPSALCTVFAPGSDRKMGSAKTGEAPDGVRVLERTTVAGYEVAVLEADDADALMAWLASNGYEARSELTDWVRPYVAAGWKVTAFKYDAQSSGPVSTAAIRMSFDTDTPLFPYRVPTDQIAPAGRGNLLRVYYVGAGRVDGALGDERGAWSATTKFASALPDLAGVLAGAVPEAALGPDLWLTAFEDTTWPSGTEDLYFQPASDPEPVVPVVVRTKEVPVFIPLDLVALALGGFFFWRYRKHNRQRNAADQLKAPDAE